VLTLPAARVTVQIKNSQQTVAAVMPHFTADTFSGTVRFHYSGDPRRLVHLEGEDNPLWLGLLLWAIPAVLWTVYFAFRRSPHWRAVLALD